MTDEEMVVLTSAQQTLVSRRSVAIRYDTDILESSFYKAIHVLFILDILRNMSLSFLDSCSVST